MFSGLINFAKHREEKLQKFEELNMESVFFFVNTLGKSGGRT